MVPSKEKFLHYLIRNNTQQVQVCNSKNSTLLASILPSAMPIPHFMRISPEKLIFPGVTPLFSKGQVK